MEVNGRKIVCLSQSASIFFGAALPISIWIYFIEGKIPIKIRVKVFNVAGALILKHFLKGSAT